MGEAITIFISYAHEDEDLRKAFDKHLSLLKRQGLIDVWHDRDISAGTDWQQAVSIYLNTAQIILLLISSDFMASEYCYSVEMKRAVERHQAKEACVIPIILRPVYWEDAPFGQFQALPTDAAPILSRKWQSQDEALVDVVRGLRRAIQDATIPLHREDRTHPIKQPLSPNEPSDTVIQITPIQIDISSLLSEIQALLEKGDYKKAITLMEKGSTEDPSKLLLHKKLFQPIPNDYPLQRQAIGEKLQDFAKIFFDKGEFSESINAFKLATAIDLPRADQYLAQLGNCYLGVGNDKDAEEAYAQSLDRDPSNWVAYLGRSEIERRRNSMTTALEAIDQAIRFAPEEYQIWNQKGVILRQLRRYSEALRGFEHALEMEPRDPIVRENKETTEKLL